MVRKKTTKKKASKKVARKKRATGKKRAPVYDKDHEAYNKKVRKKAGRTSFRDKDKVPGEVSKIRVTGSVQRRYSKFLAEHEAKMKRREKAPKYKKAVPERLILGHVGAKKGMEILCRTIEDQKHRCPRIYTKQKDPGSRFVIDMYAEISSWPGAVLDQFIREMTGKEPRDKNLSGLLGDAKRIFHELFLDEAPNTEVVLRYDSRWKMWPHVRYKTKETDMAEPGSKRATKKKKVTTKKTAVKKKAASKKSPTKKASVKKTSTKKKVSKKVSKKTAAGRGKSSTSELTEKTKIKAVKGSAVPKMASRAKIKKAVPSSGISVSGLVDKTGCNVATIQAMIDKGFLEVSK